MKFFIKLSFFCLIFTQAIAKSETWFTQSVQQIPTVDQYLRQYSVVQLDIQKSKAFYLSDKQRFTLEVPLIGGVRTIEFVRNEIHASDFKVLDSKGLDVTSTIQFPAHYKSTENGRAREFISLSVFPNGDLAMVISNQAGNVNVSKLPDSLSNAPNQYLVFNDKELKMANPFHCELDSKTNAQEQYEKKNPKSPVIQEDTTCLLTEIYWECDHDMYQKGGNSIQGALNQFEAMFNGTAILYEIENVNIGVKAVKVWNTPDPYTYTSSFTALDDFQAAGNAAGWPGQLAHLLSTRNLNLGGVAYLNAICTTFRYGFSNIDFVFVPLPIYSWTLSTIAHELGHNFASNHTHNCNWVFPNGEIHQIDSCWNAEGGCQPTIRGRVGTIMSYCHLTGSVNLSLGFGPLPGNRIRQAYAEMPCVSGTIVIPNFTPVNSSPICDGDTLVLSAEDLPGLSYLWTGPNGFESHEREAIIPNVNTSTAGNYLLSVKKAACESRQKKSIVVFNCLQVGQTPGAICAGSNVSVPFKSTGVFGAGNKFVLQLSNGIGSFANPINLDTLDSQIPQTINTVLPQNLNLGPGYKFRLLSSNPVYTGLGSDKGFSISPVGISPVAVDGSRCGPGSLLLSVNGGSNLIWYPTISELLPISFGRWFETPTISQTTSYYVQSGSTSKFFGGQNLVSGSDFDSTENGLIFDAVTGFRLDSLKVRVRKTNGVATGSFQLELKKYGQILYSKSVSYSVSAIESDILKIPLYWRIDPGNDYMIECKGSDFKLQKSVSNFPLKVLGVVSIKSQTSNVNSNEYPYLYNWVIQRYSTCPSRRVEVKAKITNGTIPDLPQVTLLNSDSLICLSPGLAFEWLINGQLYSNFGSKVLGILNLTYSVRYKIDSCWSDWSVPYLFNVTSNQSLKEMAVSIHPNPASGTIFWKGPEQETEITLFDLAGKLIWQRWVGSEESIDISGLTNGLYCIRWQTQNKSGLIKLIKD